MECGAGKLIEFVVIFGIFFSLENGRQPHAIRRQLGAGTSVFHPHIKPSLWGNGCERRNPMGVTAGWVIHHQATSAGCWFVHLGLAPGRR